jgi:cyclohexanecarboxyl-CoA dehydrogenase
MNPYLDEDLVTLGDHVRRFATDRIAPGFQERDRTRVLERQLMREMGEMGFIAPELPEKFGGQGLGCLAAGVIHEEIARADLSISYINLLASLNGQILSQHGRPEVVEQWLTKLARGEALLAIALTEPRGGSDAANLRLKAERDGDEYVINGEKTSISAADEPTHGGLWPHRRSRSAGRRDRAAGADGPARRHHQPLRLPRPARHRPRLDLLRERARAHRPSPRRREQGFRAGDAGLRLQPRADRPAGAGGGPRRA